MPRINKARFDALSPPQQQQLTAAGVKVYGGDDNIRESTDGARTRNAWVAEQENLTHEDVYPGATSAPGKEKPAPLGEHGPGGKLYPRGTGWFPGGYAMADLLDRTPENLGKEIAYTAGKATLSALGGRYLGPLASRIPVVGAITSALPVGTMIAGQAGGQYAGEIGRQALEGEPISHGRAGVEAGIVGGLGALSYGAGRVLAAGGGVSPQAAQQSAMAPGLTRKVHDDDILRATDTIRSSLARTQSVKSAGRQHVEKMIGAFDASGQTIDPSVMADSVISQIGGLANPPSQAADRLLRGFSARLRSRVAQQSTTGMYGLGQKMTAENFDKMLREEFTQQVYEYEQKFGGKMAQNAIEEARNVIAQSFYSKLGPGGAPAAAMANVSMTARERLEGVIKPVDVSKIDFSSPAKVKMAISPGSLSGRQVREAVAQYDADTGENLSQMLNDLLIRQEWTPAQSQQAQELVQLALINYRPRGLVETGMQRLAPSALWLTRHPGPRSAAASVAGMAMRPEEEP